MNDSFHDVYEQLSAHLDRLPAGFPKTPSGVEIRILKRLFTPEEARLAQLLTLRPEGVDRIAKRAGMEPEELGEKLLEMSRKGLIFRIRKGESLRYMAAQFVIGIWEYHVNDLDPDLIKDMNEYVPYLFGENDRPKTPQLRTIPLSRSLPVEQTVMPYDEARSLVLGHEHIAVAPCICRKEHLMTGDGCDKPMESCLIFGTGAQYYVENRIGRFISREEALSILADAEKSGLVLQPSNSQQSVNICTCCGCCCQILKNLKRLPNPAQYVASNYRASVDRDLCSGCGTCVERCPMNAMELTEDHAGVLVHRCIGCGVCVQSCPEEAIGLIQKPEEERVVPPQYLFDTYKQMHQERISRLHKASAAPLAGNNP